MEAIDKALSLIMDMQQNCQKFYKELLTLPESEEACQSLFDSLAAAADELAGYAEQLQENLSHAFCRGMAENIMAALFDTMTQINHDQNQKAADILRYRLFPFLQELWEEIYFWGAIWPDPEKMKRYYQEEFVSHHQNSLLHNTFSVNEKATAQTPAFKYQFTIFIPAYNNLEYTKRCLESIYRNTDLQKYSYEFILLDDGSTDGTREYLESLGVEKVICLPVNVKTLIFSLAFRICEGEYFLFVNNDTLVTGGWLENLLTCLKSDETIISATPCTPNTSNLQVDQEGRYSYTDYDSLFAHVNRSDPSLWEERTRIMPVIAMYRTSLLDRVGFADRLFYTMEFWDDDFSLRARRAGYRQFLCKDTYCHHFGSVTGGKDWEKNNTLKEGRDLFRIKNGIAPYSGDFCYNPQFVKVFKNAKLPDGPLSLLAVDSCLGDTLRMIGSYLKHLGREFTFSAINTAPDASAYQEELSLLCETCLPETDFEKAGRQWADDSLDVLLVLKPLETYADYDSLLRFAFGKLKSGGLFLSTLTNLSYRPFLESLLALSFPGDRELLRCLNFPVLIKRLKTMFRKVDCITEMERKELEGLEEFMTAHIKNEDTAAAKILQSSQYLNLCCTK